MRTVDLIQRKRDGEELSPEEITYLVDGYTRGEIPDYQMAAFLMAVFHSGMTDREVSALTETMVASGETVDLSDIPGIKVDKHSTGGVGDKTSLIAAPLAASAGAVVPMISGRALGHTGGTLDKLESIPGFRTNLTIDEFREQLHRIGLCFIGQTPQVAPADGRFYALRDATATVESIPLIASSIMSKKIAMGIDALVLDVKVGSGAFMKRQVDARRLAQMMVGIGRRVDKRVQALITDMNQPLGFAVGNALEVMEVSQTLQNAGPTDLTRLSLELAARMIHLGKQAQTIEEAREIAQAKLLDGSGYRKLKEVIEAQGGNPQVLDRFELLPNATGVREITSPRAGYVTAIDAGDIGRASAMIGAGRDTKEDTIDPAVGVILEVKTGQKIDAGSVLCRLYHTREDDLDEGAQLVEDAFRISTTMPEERALILEVVS
ncbi:MAG: thymidine phosphorylase [Bryobacteraceae bacterium]|nr:thymidine phosphorylase [Bryobacterales bacterium]MEB2361198.1 thymidine phosphorylase [Bryobacterales bacterium]NUN02000.1 thymidine phosphorylase [Bryobacteraceae bacterium]